MHDTNHQSRITNHAGYEIRENEMLENKTTTTIGTASAAIAGLALAASLLLTPSAAVADNECGLDDPTVNGSLADSYDCPDADYPEGVTYAADGDLTVNFTNGSVSTIGENPDNGGDDPQPGDDLTDMGGIDLSAMNGDSITFDSATTTTEIESNGVLGALLSVTTVDGDIDIDTEDMDADESAAGVTHGIFAESTGTGSIDINTTGNVDARGSNPEDSIGIQAVTGSGNLTITASGTVNSNGTSIDATTGTGLLTINVSGSGDVRSGVRTDSDGGTVINVASDADIFGGITSGGTTWTLNNDGTVSFGAIDLSDLTGGYTFNNNPGGLWRFGDVNRSTIVVSDMGSGVLNNAGTIELENGGVVSAPGATYQGSGAALLDMRVLLDGVAYQASCGTTVAGCLDLSGGTTAGQTGVRIRAQVPGSLSLPTRVNAGILLVDVKGGTSSVEHFVLDPGSDNYATDPKYGSVLDFGGMLDYTLLYNPDTQQHILASVPQREAIEYVAFIDEALSTWHATTEGVAGRQADLRDGATGKAWFRAVGESISRDTNPSVTTHGNTFDYEQGYSFYTGAAIAGFDLTSGDEHVIGVHGGFVMSSKLKFDETSTQDKIDGVTAGVYGGRWKGLELLGLDGLLTLDGTVNLNLLELSHSVEGFEHTDTNVMTLGIRGEAGWRLPLLAEALYVQPMVAAAYAKSNVDEIPLTDNDLRFKGEETRRFGGGVRLGGDVGIRTGGRLGYWLTARAWEEYADDGRVEFLVNGGDNLAIEDDLSGSFEEITIGANFTNEKDTLSFFVSGGTKLLEGTDDSHNFSMGVRLNW